MSEGTNMDGAGAGTGAGEGGGAPAWYKADGFTPEMQGFIENKGWVDSPMKAVEAYQNLEKFHGVPADQLVKLPKDMTDGEAMKAVYAKLGRPETAEGYGNLEVPEGASLDANRLKHFDGIFHAVGLSSAQRNTLAQAVVKWETEYAANLQKEIEIKQKADYEGLRNEWGQKADEREELARRAVRRFLPVQEEQKAEFLANLEAAIGTSTMLKMFANIADGVNGMREDTAHDGSTSPTGTRFGYTKEQATADRQKLMDDLKRDPRRYSEYSKGSGSDYERMMNLNKIIVGYSGS